MRETYLYPYSAEEACRRGEQSLWRASYLENIDCKDAIQKAVRQHYDGDHLDKKCLTEVIQEFGYKRTAWVLANTVQQLEWGGQYSSENKAWASQIYIPPDKLHNLSFEGHLVEVTKDVYLTYYRVERHTKTLDEKDVRNGKVSYSDLDTEETLGEEMVPDPNAESVEDKAVGNILLQELRQCLAQLPLEEQNLIRALYFEELTEREYAKQINISQKAVNKRRHKILSKLRTLMKIK